MSHQIRWIGDREKFHSWNTKVSNYNVIHEPKAEYSMISNAFYLKISDIYSLFRITEVSCISSVT